MMAMVPPFVMRGRPLIDLVPGRDRRSCMVRIVDHMQHHRLLISHCWAREHNRYPRQQTCFFHPYPPVVPSRASIPDEASDPPAIVKDWVHPAADFVPDMVGTGIRKLMPQITFDNEIDQPSIFKANKTISKVKNLSM
jgi:hypothetical protein